MARYTSRNRRDWIAHYAETGNVSQTCREFGITRATFYKWFKRYDPDRPAKPLLSMSSKPRTTRRSSRSQLDILILAEMNLKFPTWGAGKLADQMREYEIPMSRATAGRLLSQIKRRCPRCRGRGGHDFMIHVLGRDLDRFQLKIDERRALLDFALSGLN